MKKIASSIIVCFILVFFLGCDRMEKAVDVYSKVKKDAQQKSQQAQDEAKGIVNKKLKTPEDKALEEDEAGEDSENKD